MWSDFAKIVSGAFRRLFELPSPAEEAFWISDTYDRSIHVWTLAHGGALENPLIGHTDGLSALAITERKGRSVIISGSFDGSVRIWDLEQLQPVGTPLLHEGWVTALTLAKPQGRSVIISASHNNDIPIGHHDNRLHIWDLERGEKLGTTLTGHSDRIMALAVANRGGRSVIIAGGEDTVGKYNRIKIWDLEEGSEVGAPLRGHTNTVAALAIAERQGRNVVVSASHDRTIRIWDLEHGEPIGAPLTGHTGAVAAVSVGDRRGKRVIISGGDDNTIRIWDLASFDLQNTIEIGAYVRCVAFAAPSTIVAGTAMGLIAINLGSRPEETTACKETGAGNAVGNSDSPSGQ